METFPADAAAPVPPNRESYLVHELLDAAVHPFPRYTTLDGLAVTTVKQTADNIALNCVQVETTDQLGHSYVIPDTVTFCAQPVANALRLIAYRTTNRTTRNSVGQFHDDNVALDYQISYGNRMHDQLAITGHVNSLQTFDPEKTVLRMGAPPNDRFDQLQIPEQFVRGRILETTQHTPGTKPPPTLLSGSVHLRGLIAKNGSVTDLVVMSSPDQLLSDWAIYSVSGWRYEPYVVGGRPVEVVANFYINSRQQSNMQVPRLPH